MQLPPIPATYAHLLSHLRLPVNGSFFSAAFTFGGPRFYLTRLLRRCGRLPEDPRPTDPVAEQMPLLAGYTAASIQALIATGPRAGQPVRRLRTAAAVLDEAKPRCAGLKGFSLHANVALPAHTREQLEHLCRYLLRPPQATERLTESSGGQLLYELPHARRDGSTHLLLDPLELIEKLSTLVPPLGKNSAR